ncbi:carbohydrate ABC transporter substrate-binding protein (CUT1 family) [Solirubrobacter pauli]|uniref:Carbohydrate ABC transporter substrate-binding protein (CUT1 family) n=1 Tax=Solirubrobacter pauli TaxID=166793 RepID=A0A660KYK9_9ACTN|nr:extracellular solute-binding protein [Solirubrobacter pauli]RKQ86726.1 carbohydrate ABC transporter substrate-binding protein (CUT1 family) [Solirubrobacter pauli]
MKGRFAVSASLTAMAAAVTLAACGGDDGGSGGDADKAPAKQAASALSDKPMDLTFIWFDWPPAKALEELGKEYTKTRPNVTVKVNTVPNPQWHDAIFTQFAARKTNFDLPILDSQNIGEAVDNGSILDLTDFVKENIDTSQYDPYFLAAYGQYPQNTTGKADPDAKTYGLPLLGDTWSMIWRKDLMGDTPPATWEDMIAAAKKCQDENKGMSGLAFHQAGTGDAAAVTYNVMNALYGGELWNQQDKKIDGVINDAAGKKAMDVLVNQMVPLTPKGSSNWFIDEVNAAISQGKVCVGFQWIAAMGGLLDPASSELGKTKEEILDKLAFAPLPKQVTDKKPLGGMGLHVSKYIPAEKQAEALNFIKWFQTPEAQKKWAQLGGVPARNDVLNSPDFLEATPYNKVFTDSVSQLKDFWNLPEYAKLLNVHSTQVNAAISGTQQPEAALDKLAKDEQKILDESGGL